MKKMVGISNCSGCPHRYSTDCAISGKKIPEDVLMAGFPDWCLLPNEHEIEFDIIEHDRK